MNRNRCIAELWSNLSSINVHSLAVFFTVSVSIIEINKFLYENMHCNMCNIMPVYQSCPHALSIIFYIIAIYS